MKTCANLQEKIVGIHRQYIDLNRIVHLLNLTIYNAESFCLSINFPYLYISNIFDPIAWLFGDDR